MSISKTIEIWGKYRILHLDDDELLLNTIKQSLESQNKNILVDVVLNSSDLINKIRKNYYDCILLDYTMPFNNGVKIATKIRTISDVPIILYTIYNPKEISELMNCKLFNVHLQKDINDTHYDILENTIITLSEKYRAIKISEKIIEKEDFYLILNKENNIVYYDNKFQDYLGGSDLLNKPIFEIVETKYRDDLYKYLNDEKNKLDEIIINYNNDNRYVKINKFKLHNDSEYLLILIRDLTLNIVKEELNDNSDKRFDTISKLSTDAIITLSQFGYITYINKAFSNLTGFAKEEIVGKHVISLPTLKGRNIGPYMDILKQFLRGDFEEIKYDFPYTRKDGTSGIGSAIAQIIKVNGGRELVSIIKDVTSEKQTAEEYKKIFESSPEGIIHLDMDGNIKNINNSALNIFNEPAEYYMGKNIFSMESEIINKNISFKEIYDDLMLNKEIPQFELEINIENMSVWIEVKVSTIKSLEEPLGIQILLKDITQRKQIEEERIIYTENLEKLVEERTNQIMDNEKMFTLAKVTSMIGHDLKGPLQVISNSLHLMKMRPENQEQYIVYIQKAIEQSNDLIKEMQEIGKDAPLAIEKVNIENIIEESLFQIKTSENIIFEIKMQIDETVNLDKSKFIRVFNNLFKNAIEAMPEGGKISVIGVEVNENIVLEICDTGSGIPQEKIDNIFRPFQSTKRKGMGLGLNYCKNTVEAHGGKITVESEVGIGTKFIICIPKKINI